MSPKKKTPRRSQWLVINRCMDLLLCLMRGPTPNDDLLKMIHEDARQNDDELVDSAARKRFEEDRSRLKTWFGAELDYSRAENTYTLLNITRPLLDLSDESIQGMAFLTRTFSGNDAPMAPAVRAFLGQVSLLLPIRRRHEIDKQRGLLEMQLGVRDEDDISPETWEAVRTSVIERRQLEFTYFSASSSDGQPRSHRVEPIRYFFDTVRKHYYLEAFWLESKSYLGTRDQKRRVQRFRMGRMTLPHILPTHFPANQRIPKKELVYVLKPEVARMGVTRHFEDMQVIENEDGSARVHVMSSDLFFDLRTLLHYGDNCHVIGGDEAVQQMTSIVQRLAEIYT